MAEPTILNGLVGGLVATVVMTAVMMVAGDDSPPPTALLWSKYVGDHEPEEYMMQGVVIHFVYGVGAGAVLAAALTAVGVSPGLVTGLVAGAVYGFVMFLVGAVFWMNAVLGLDPGRKQAVMFLALHLIYGVVLGGWLGLGYL